jgi:hypothetical protein
MVSKLIRIWLYFLLLQKLNIFSNIKLLQDGYQSLNNQNVGQFIPIQYAMFRILKEDSEQIYQSRWQKTLVTCLKYLLLFSVFYNAPY